MADKEYRIRILTVADSSGADQAASGISKVTEETHKSAEGFAHAESKGRAFHQLMHRVAEGSPDLAAGLKLFLNPIAGAIGLATLMITRMQEGIKKLQESLTVTEWDRYEAVVQKVRSGLEGSRLEAAAFAQELRKVAEATETASQQGERLAEIRKAQLSADEALAAASEHLELAKAKTIQDPIARAQKELEIEERYAEAKRKRADAEARIAVEETRQKISGESASGIGLEARLGEARSRQRRLGTEETVNEKIRIEEERLAKIRADRAKHEDRLEELDRKHLDPTDTEFHERRHLRGVVEGDQSVESAQKRYIDRLRGMHEGQVGAIRAADEEVKSLEGELKATVQRIKALQTGLPTQETVAGIGIRGRANQSTVTRSAGAFTVGAEGGAADAAFKFTHGGALSGQETRELDAAMAYIGATRKTGESVIKALAAAHGVIGSQEAQIDELRKKFEQIRGQTKSAVNP